MRLRRYYSTVAAGTAGILAGLFFDKLSPKQHVTVSGVQPYIQQLYENGFSDSENAAEFNIMMKYGFPRYDLLLHKHSFVAGYDSKNKISKFVMEYVTPSMLEGTATRHSQYFEDKDLHRIFRAYSTDYDGNIYERGHLAARANYKHSQEACKETNVMSNIAPQTRCLNRKSWSLLEKKVRKTAVECGSVYVCSGPLFISREMKSDDALLELIQDSNGKKFIPSIENESKENLKDENKRSKRKKGDNLNQVVQDKENRPIQNQNSIQKGKQYMIYEVIGQNKVAVPTHYFKVILWEHNDNIHVRSYIFPNQDLEKIERLKRYKVSLHRIEAEAGFFIFPHLKRDVDGKLIRPITMELNNKTATMALNNKTVSKLKDETVSKLNKETTVELNTENTILRLNNERMELDNERRR